jgi:D-glycero-D-manno-heptose 1,7-bisphosphate phosphatase
MIPAVFLDRDGTLIEEAGYLDRLERLAFFPFTVDAVRLLNNAGLAVVIVSNQSGVGRGLVRPAFVAEAHDAIAARLAAGGARIDAFYHCPHHPQASIAEYRLDCECRKPAAGMLRQAANDLNLDLARSFVVGDRLNDVAAARAVGARAILVRTGYGRLAENDSTDATGADGVVDNLAAAASWILRRL